MLLKLTLKDIKACKNIYLFRIILPMAFLSNIFNLRFLSWDVYFMFGCMLICVSGSFFVLFKKSRNAEVLACSLPVTRASIVFAKYLTSVVFAVISMIILLFNSYIADFIHPNGPADFKHFFNSKVLFIALFLYLIYSSLFFPAALRLQSLGGIVTLVIALITVVTATAFIFRPGWRSYVPYFKADDFLPVMVMLIIVVFMFGSSIFLTKKLYIAKDL